MPRRPFYLLAWVATTAAATLVGLGAVGFVRAASGGEVVARPLSQEQVSAALAQTATDAPSAPAVTTASSAPRAPRATPAPTPVSSPPRATASRSPSSTPRATASRTSAPAPTPRATRSPAPTTAAAVRAAFSSAGGSVVAECRGSTAYLVSWSPADGYVVDEVERGPDDHVKVRFAAGEQRVTIEVRCSGGRPVAQVESEDHD